MDVRPVGGIIHHEDSFGKGFVSLVSRNIGGIPLVAIASDCHLEFTLGRNRSFELGGDCLRQILAERTGNRPLQSQLRVGGNERLELRTALNGKAGTFFGKRLASGSISQVPAADPIIKGIEFHEIGLRRNLHLPCACRPVCHSLCGNCCHGRDHRQADLRSNRGGWSPVA